MNRRTADLIFTLSGSPVKDGIVVTDADEKVLTVLQPGDAGYDRANADYFPGWIVPGFVNAHCHLELSHLKGLISSGTGLNGFIEALMLQRDAGEETRRSAMLKADREMQQAGIVFTGDISNGSGSFYVKEVSEIAYHTFIERFGFNSNKADDVMEGGYALLETLKGLPRNSRGNHCLHAPYSVSLKLLDLICRELLNTGGILSIHNQETFSERELFINGTGPMAERLVKMGISDQTWNPPGISSLTWLGRRIPENIRVLLVHNTFTEAADLQEWCVRDAWFCLCPGANLFIEQRLPDIELFRRMQLKMVIGTDSLASNNQLDIWEELKLIAGAYPAIEATELLEWACMNGALLFNVSNLLGTIEPGKQPGLVWISNADPEGKKILPQSRAQRL